MLSNIWSRISPRLSPQTLKVSFSLLSLALAAAQLHTSLPMIERWG
jgi:hypothetical protein